MAGRSWGAYIAIILAAVTAAGCASGAAQQVPVASETGPITFAIGSDDIGWLTPLIAGWNKTHPARRSPSCCCPRRPTSSSTS